MAGSARTVLILHRAGSIVLTDEIAESLSQQHGSRPDFNVLHLLVRCSAFAEAAQYRLPGAIPGISSWPTTPGLFWPQFIQSFRSGTIIPQSLPATAQQCRYPQENNYSHEGKFSPWEINHQAWHWYGLWEMTVGLSLRTSHSGSVTSVLLTNADGPIYHGGSDVRNIHRSAGDHRPAQPCTPIGL